MLSNEKEQYLTKVQNQLTLQHLQNVKTFVKKKDGGMIKQAQRNYDGSYISGSLGGVQVGNPSLKKYYKGML